MHFKQIILFFSAVFVLASCSQPEFVDRPADNTSNRILIDASHDGGVWWYPQAGTYDHNQAHQGSLLAAYLRSRGFVVDEIPSYIPVTDSLLSIYSNVIRAGNYGSYSTAELNAYDKLISRGGSLFLISEFLQPGSQDQLASHLGLNFGGTKYAQLDSFAVHPAVTGATSFYYNAGSYVLNQHTNPDIEVLGWLDHDPNLPAMGILHHPKARIFFIGDFNGIEGMPQPVVSTIVKWLFR